MKKVLKMLARLGAGVLVGVLLGRLMIDDMFALFDRGLDTTAVMLIVLVLMYLAYFVQIIFHEAGHMVFALLSGYRFVSFRVLNFVWIRQDGRLRVKRFGIPGTLGQCLMDPPEMKDGKYPFMLYHMGGAIMDLIVFAVCAGVWYVLAWEYWMAGAGMIYLASQAVWALFSALRNGIPMKNKLISNDGHNILTMRSNPDARRAMWIQMKFMAETAQGRLTTEMPGEWFEMPDDGQLQNGHVAWLALMILDRLFAEGKMQGADALVKHLLEIPSGLGGISRYGLVCERIFLEAIGENNQETLETLRTGEQLTAMKRMKTHLSVIRAEYAYALLTKKDERQAKQARKRFDEAGSRYPYPQVVESERKLMELADRRYEELAGKTEE